jgi:hypothetical protein
VALRPLRIAWQDGRAESDALAAIASAIAYAWLAHGNRADAGHDRTLGQVSVAYDPSPTILSRAIGVMSEELRHLGLDSPREQRTRARKTSVSESVKLPGSASWKNTVRHRAQVAVKEGRFLAATARLYVVRDR